MISLSPSSVEKNNQYVGNPSCFPSCWKRQPRRWMISLPPSSVGSDPTPATLKRLQLDDVAEKLAATGNGGSNGAG